MRPPPRSARPSTPCPTTVRKPTSSQARRPRRRSRPALREVDRRARSRAGHVSLGARHGPPLSGRLAGVSFRAFRPGGHIRERTTASRLVQLSAAVIVLAVSAPSAVPARGNAYSYAAWATATRPASAPAATRSRARASAACTRTRTSSRRQHRAPRSLRRLLRREDVGPARAQIQARHEHDDARHDHDRRQRHRLRRPHLPVHAVRLLRRARQHPREPPEHARRRARPRLHDGQVARRARREDRRPRLSRVFSCSSCFGSSASARPSETKANALADASTACRRPRSRRRRHVQERDRRLPGHAVCSSTPWLNGLNLFNTGESYHPNRAGHSSGYLPLVTAVTG